MINLEKKVKINPLELMKKTKNFFGSGGQGLMIISENDCNITFQGGGGHLSVTLKEDDQGFTRVQIESREWDYQAKKFLAGL